MGNETTVMIDTRYLYLTVLGCGSSSVAIDYRGSRIQMKPETY